MAQTVVHLVTRHPCARSASFGHQGLVSSFMKKDVSPPSPLLIMSLFQVMTKSAFWWQSLPLAAWVPLYPFRTCAPQLS